MHFSRWFAALLLVAAVLFQGPVLSSHALTHSLDPVHEHSSHPPESHLSAPGCALCDTYQAQNSILAIASFRDFALQETSNAVGPSTSEAECRRPVAFRSRAPPTM